VRTGDSYYQLSVDLAASAGVTADQIAAANPRLNPQALPVGEVIAIPAGGVVPQPVVPADNIGYWNRTWSPSAAPAGATLGLAFSGWTDPTAALQNSAAVVGSLVGTKFISLGGGNANGAFKVGSFAAINAAIEGGTFAAYGGIAYDVEEGDTDLATSFQQSFALAKAKGFQVLVTVSHSAPYGIGDAQALMTAFFADGNVDFLSPQLYTTGTETTNDFATSGGVTWPQYATAKAAIIPSIVNASLYTDAKTTFAGYGVTTTGYVVWG